MTVYIFSKYGELGASSRYRIYQYLPSLRLLGINTRVFPFFDDSTLQKKYLTGSNSIFDSIFAVFRRIWKIVLVPRRSVVLIEYELIPFFPPIFEFWLKFRHCRILLDYDDAIFHKYDTHKLSWVRLLLGSKIAKIMRLSDQLIVGNTYLADYAVNAGCANVEILPTVVDVLKYCPKSAEDLDTPVTIGWIGSPTTSQYLKLIQPALDALCKHRQVRLRLIGSSRIDLGDVPVEFVPWAESSEASEIQHMDIGIMPLLDDPWARGKCGLKLIQYMAGGLPVVASSVGTNLEIVNHGRNGYLASTLEEWFLYLDQLASSSRLRQEMGAAGRRLVEQRYSLDKTAPRWAELVVSLGH